MAKKTAAQLNREIKAVLSRRLPVQQASPSARRMTDELEEAAYAVFERPLGEDLTRLEFREEVLGLLRGTSAETVEHIDTLYARIYGGA